MFREKAVASTKVALDGTYERLRYCYRVLDQNCVQVGKTVAKFVWLGLRKLNTTLTFNSSCVTARPAWLKVRKDTFQQLASLGPDEIETLSKEIKHFGSRIRRDRWVEQAQELAGKSA